ncbi:hypothetical protein ALP24_05666 [Pseudomonas syringae pv. aptata]|uniref:Uncharacterized protein n=1 Tax=Pseudomonas syringae pv. aptata TaxID=83167 RepID=A0A3M5WEU8_PSEAP|nr:hypothetical protein ALP24_05666 [Pseudomonas syringae pv. aptata]
MHQKAQAILRVIRVQRHVSAPGLEDGQQADNHLQTALGGQPDAHIRADAEGEQVMRQAVGLTVELAVAQRSTFEDDRTLGLPTRDLGFDQAMHAIGRLGQRCRAVPLIQYLFAFGIADQRQCADRLLGVQRHLLQQLTIMPAQALDAGLVEQVGVVFHQQAQHTVALDPFERQVELGRGAPGAVWRHAQARHLCGVARGVLQHHHHLKQRRIRGIALRVDGLHHAVERHILMRVDIQQSGAYFAQQLGKGLLRIETLANHLSVDEMADQRLDFGTAAVGEWRTDAQVSLSAVAPEQDRQRADQHVEQRALGLSGQCIERTQGGAVDRRAEGRPDVALHDRTRPVGRHVEQRRRVGQRALPELQLPGQRLVAQTLLLPAGVIGALHRQRRQTGRLTA